jgi:uncharacterized protein (DUF3084 family)
VAKTMGDRLNDTYLNSKQARITAILSMVLASAALTASGVSAYFAYEDSITDSLWQEQQVTILKQGNTQVEVQNKKLLLLLSEKTEMNLKLEALLSDFLNSTNQQRLLNQETLKLLNSHSNKEGAQ